MLLATGTLAAADKINFFEPVQPPRAVQVMVHRGLSTAAPENTRRSITMAAADSLEWVEVDVRLSSDSKHVLFHDSTLDAKSNGSGPLHERTLAELQSLDIGSWFAPRFANERILTLQEALDLARGRINLYLDAKQIDPDTIAREVIDADMTRQVILYAAPTVLRQVHAASNGQIPLMAKWSPAMGDPAAFVQSLHLSAVEIDPPHVSKSNSESFHQLGIKVQAKALGNEHDQPSFWTQCADAKIDWIQTDDPISLLMTLAKKRAGQRWPVKIAHHRGASRYAPENSLPAIEAANRMRADYIEIDIRTTQDGQFVLMHDRRADRTTSLKGDVSLLSLTQLKQAELGSRFGRPFAQARVPTLDEAAAALGPSAHFYLDAKEISPEALADFIQRHHLEERSVVYDSPEYLARLKKILPAARVMPPLDRIEEIDALLPLVPFAVDASWSALSRELIERCHQHHIEVFSDALGVNERIARYRQAIDWGIDVIQTDHPARLLRAIELLVDDHPSTR
jgi:glycerophosphoryl diester phosphodiesterase